MDMTIMNSSHQDILLIEDFIDYIKSFPLRDSFIVLLVHEDCRIVPTLSIKKNRDSNSIKPFESIDEIQELFNIGKEKNFFDIIKELKTKYLIFENEELSKNAAIITSKNDTIDEKYLNNILKYHRVVSSQSLNRSNDSYKIRKNIRKNIEKYLDINSSLFAQNLCSYFNKENECIDFYPMSYNSIKTNKWKCTGKCPIDIWKVCNQFEKQVTKEKVPLAIKVDGIYYIVFPFISDLTDNYLKDIIVIKSHKKIPKYMLDNLRHIINYYFAVYLRDKKQDILDRLTNKTKNLNEKIKSILDKTENFKIEDLLSETWVKDIFKEITLISNAHSISFRLYYPLDKLLKRICEYSDNHIEENTSKNTMLYANHEYYIKSQVVRAFIDKKIYYTKLITEQNRKKFYTLRTNTKSILSIPISNEKKIIGILNFESLIEGGLGIEKDYLKEFSNYLSYFIQQVYMVSDIYWLTKRGNVYQNYHELENILRTDESLSFEVRCKIEKLVEMIPISGNKVITSLYELEELKEHFLDSKKNDFKKTLPIFEIDSTYAKYVAGCKFNISSDEAKSILVSKSCIDSLKVIYKTLLDNYNKHADRNIDTLAVNLSSNDNPKVLNFVIVVHNLISFNKRWVFESPYYSKKDKRYHYGLFITGRLTRHLGGNIDIVFEKKSSRTIVKINIPIMEQQ